MIDTVEISPQQLTELRKRTEGHFFDFKSKDIGPAKTTKAVSAFQNADGGELWIGINDPKKSDGKWNGFPEEEDANGLIQTLQQTFSIGTYLRVEFVRCLGEVGLCLHLEADKSHGVSRASDGTAYLRRGASSLPCRDEALRQLELSKGVVSYEGSTLALDPTELETSDIAKRFMDTVVPSSTPEKWLRKQRLIVGELPTVAGTLLFSDEPQAALPNSTIKIARYNTSDDAAREHLAGVPETIEGPAYDCIRQAVRRVAEIAEAEPVLGREGLEKVKYPQEAIHEIITNAVIHRDYSINDAVHIRIFNNRIEIVSPGRLPAHITPKNILAERFARNPTVVRLLNKFPEPPNQDIGEGLNTAFEAMKKLSLKEPTVTDEENKVSVTLRHERLASPEVAILQHLIGSDEVNNSKARQITGIGSENKVKNIFNKMMEAGLIEKVPGRAGNKTSYRITTKGKKQAEGKA